MEIPKKGFYYQYTEDTQRASVEKFAYELLRVVYRPSDNQYFAVYRPLFEESSLDFTFCPLNYFIGTIPNQGKNILRFQQISDMTTLACLEVTKKRLYDDTDATKEGYNLYSSLTDIVDVSE